MGWIEWILAGGGVWLIAGAGTYWGLCGVPPLKATKQNILTVLIICALWPIAVAHWAAGNIK